MREHSNSCTKWPLKDNKMTSIYSVYHGVNKHINKQQPPSSSTTITTTHNAHPLSPHHCHCQPPTTTWTHRYTIQTMQECHVSSRQVDGRQQQQRGMSTDIWWWQCCVQPQVSTHSLSLQSPSWPRNRCHVIYMATRWWMMMSFIVIFSDNNDDWPQPQPQQMMTMPQQQQDNTTWWDDNATMTTHHPQMAPMVTSA